MSQCMELFSKRRWTTGLTQQSNIKMCCIIFFVCQKHNNLQLGPIQQSYPSTKELHDQSVSLILRRLDFTVSDNGFSLQCSKLASMCFRLVVAKQRFCIPGIEFNHQSSGIPSQAETETKSNRKWNRETGSGTRNEFSNGLKIVFAKSFFVKL